MLNSYEKLLKKATWLTVLASLFLVMIKLITCWLTGSISLLASLIDSSMDLLASTLNFFLIRYSLKPADDSHMFGHGKAESLSVLAQSSFIIGSATILCLTSIKIFIHPNPIKLPLFGIAVSILSILVTLGVVIYQKRIIKLTQSKAIHADMLHYFADLLMNVGVIIALFLSWNGIVLADGIFAIMIASYLFYSASKVAWGAVQELLDRSLSDEENNHIIKIVSSCTEIKGMHDLKTRQTGSVKFIQLHIELEDNISFIKAHSLADKIEKQLSQTFYPAEVIIHQDPESVVPQEMKKEKKPFK